jgi:hypothetical protein
MRLSFEAYSKLMENVYQALFPVFHGPVIARVRPRRWTLTKRVVPSGEKVAPANSLPPDEFRANL